MVFRTHTVPLPGMTDDREQPQLLLVNDGSRPSRIDVVCNNQVIDSVSLLGHEDTSDIVVELLRAKLEAQRNSASAHPRSATTGGPRVAPESSPRQTPRTAAALMMPEFF
jgi:hypothetical protein